MSSICPYIETVEIDGVAVKRSCGKPLPAKSESYKDTHHRACAMHAIVYREQLKRETARRGRQRKAAREARRKAAACIPESLARKS